MHVLLQVAGVGENFVDPVLLGFHAGPWVEDALASVGIGLSAVVIAVAGVVLVIARARRSTASSRRRALEATQV